MIFCQNLSLAVPKNFVGNYSPLCFGKVPEAKMLMDKREVGRVSRFSVK